jgi:enoyl-CoA hydratase/carnithine racemase
VVAELEYEVSDGIGTITLNRPAKRNAFTLAMAERWAEVYQAARTDSAVAVVVVTGAEQSFCSGVDLAELEHVPATPLARKQMLTDQIHRVAYALEDLDKPVIAAVNGAAIGAGMDMALMCDIRLAGRSARFSEGYINVGLVPGDGGCYYLPRLVGTAKALELMLTGDVIDGTEAARVGIANHVYEDSDLLPKTYEFARKLAAAPPVAVRIIKRAVYQSARADLRTSLDLISSHMAVVQSTRDSAAAYEAFSTRRPAVFEGR